MRFCISFLILLLNLTALDAQKKRIESYNQFIDELNANIENVNNTQQNLQQYHQDIFRYYRIFDTLTVTPFTHRELTTEFTEIPDKVYSAVEKYESNVRILDSISQSISFEKDLTYNEEKIDSMNLRVDQVTEISNKLQLNLEEIQLAFLENDLESRKKSYRLMLEELQKVEFFIKKFKKRKLELHEINYEIPIKIRKQLPVAYLEVLEEFQNRVDSCSAKDNREEIIHYFMPKKYFDKWILKKYNLHYWQVKYLEDILIRPSFQKGLQSQYNEKIKSYSLNQIKSINQYQSIPFEFVPLTDSPLGRHKKIFTILILDISNSMNESGKLSQLKESVKTFVDALRPQDKFSIILFSNVSQELILPGEKDTEFIKYKIDEIKAYGNTLPESAIFRAYNIMNLQTNSEFDSQAILITDGIFEVTGKMKYHIQQGKKKDIVFSIINIENKGEDYRDLQKLSEVSDGKLYFIDGYATYETLIKEIMR